MKNKTFYAGFHALIIDGYLLGNLNALVKMIINCYKKTNIL